MKFFRRAAFGLLAVVLLGVVVPVIARPAEADAQATDVVISEFLASNTATLADNTGDFADWIELHNTSGSTIDLDGWIISDGGDLFVFPIGSTIASNEYLVIWASGDITRTTPSELHLPFKLSAAGESLTLTDPNGTIAAPSWPAPSVYPPQLEDDSYGIASGGQIRYFTSPTPGSANGGGAGGVVDAVSFSVDHGFYSSSQTLILDTATTGATIRYTTNGETPTAANGTALTPGSSITVNGTTTIRAIAYRDGWISSPVETRSYLFTDDIIQQGRPAGWPTGPVNGQVLNYGMDPNVVDGNEAAVEAALVGIPTISIVTDLDNLFDSTNGIYVNAEERGSAWERQASVELIDPSGAEPGFDIEAGLRIRGGYSRIDPNAKHALRVYFRDDYESQLDYPLFGDEGVSDFEIMDLRTASNYAWSWRHTRTASFIDELWSRDTQAAMGQPYTRSRQYHLYLNGTYWGLYMSQERVSGEYGETYFGGNEDDYDVMKRNAPGRETEAGDGTDVAWKSLYPLVSDLNVTSAEYDQIADQVDIVNLADYYLLHFWTGDFDGSPSWYFSNDGRWKHSNNWFALRNRNGVGQAAKWRFFDHDSEHSLCANGGPSLEENIDNTTPWNLNTGLGDQYMSPAWLHAALITNDTYRQIFADRVQLHMLTPGGALTVPEALARLEVRAAEVSPAIEGESARWGDGGGEPAYGRSDWEYAVQLKRDCFSDRLPIVENQLRDDGLWPLSDPPSISPESGAVPYGTNVVIDDVGLSGTTYYTIDGSDPRGPDGSTNPNAIIFGGPFSIVGDLSVKARILSNGEWSPLVEANYTLSSPAGPVTLAVNEFNAVSAGKFLGGGTAADTANGSDLTFGRVDNNGGDWFELVVIEDDLDIRGWTFEVWNIDNGIITNNATLTLTNDDVFNGLRKGTLLTVSEDIDDDVSYNPIQDDWHINVRSNNALDGAYVTAETQSNFGINNSDTQIAIFDAAGTPVQLRTGEGTVPGISVNSTEMFKLEGAPTTSLTPDSPLYADGTSSSWGLPNVYSGGQVQDLSDLRIVFGDVDCDGLLTIGDALVVAQYAVRTRSDSASCPLANPGTQLFASAGDVNGSGAVDIGDALLIAQCTVGLANEFCP